MLFGLAWSPANATISSTQSSIVIQGNGAATVFSASFVADATSDISVIYTDANGNQTTLLPTQYSISISPPLPGQIWGTAFFVTYPLSGPPIASNTSLTISRILPLQQTTVLNNQGVFYPQVVEIALDTLEMQTQQVSARTGQQRGTWVSGATYNFGDVVQDGINGGNSGSYYMCAMSNISGVWTTDLANGDWSLVIQSVIPAAPFPLSVANGGTGASTPGAALNNLGGISLSGNNAFTGNNTHSGSEAFTGSTTVPTAGAGDASSKAASTNFVNNTALTLKTGTTAITQAANNNSTDVATTQYVDSNAFTTKQTWTPVLQFGGAASGITYMQQTGTYIQIGKVIVAEFDIALSALGSSTGAATITGLPANENGSQRGFCGISFYSGMSGMSAPSARIDGSTSFIDLLLAGSTAVANITNTNFGSTSQITGTCTYIAQ